MVTKVYAIDTDPYWSVNIKRGIISLMNLDLNVENPAPVESSISKSFMGVVSSDYSTMSAKTVYRVIEVNIGITRTIYCHNVYRVIEVNTGITHTIYCHNVYRVIEVNTGITHAIYCHNVYRVIEVNIGITHTIYCHNVYRVIEVCQ